jgi:HupE / UreJ protein
LDKMLPFHVNLEQGTNWKGFQSMLLLGMEHIRLGYDHLLFLFLLLLSAPLSMVDRNWSHYLGHKESLKILIKIITAFTIGHSIALLFGTLGYNPFPTQWVEVTIAISITITAIHLMKPIIYNKELWIASGFGLIHGLAFSEVLIRLGLNNAQLAISLLGFNLGIELMQLLLVFIILPFILLLCNYQFKFYQSFRILIAIASIFISFYWIVDRVFLF